MPDGKNFRKNSTFFCGRISSSACRKASITIEAALAVPLFFLAVISLFYLLEIMAVRTSVRTGLQAAGKVVMEEGAVLPVVIPGEVEADIIRTIGGERLDRSIVVGGSSGIHCEQSYLSPATGIGKLTAQYEIRLPMPVFAVPPISYQESMRIKVWSGYEKSTFGKEDDETVYVTETGIVYHKDYHCTYMELSIRHTDTGQLENLRNESGGKYFPCERCVHTQAEGIYVTNTGDRYHNSLSCSGLKRTIYAVPLSEAIGKGACSRCGG